MTENASPRPAKSRRSRWCLSLICGLSALFLASSAFAAPLYLCLIDRLPPAGDSALPSLDKPQRDAAFRAAVQTAASGGELPPATVLDPGTPAPAGATLLRVYLKEWSNKRHNGLTDTDVSCRFYAEVVREGRTIRRFGPCEGRTDFDPTAMTSPEARSVVFQVAARRAIDDLGRALPR